jgi:hypothetical protein
MTVGQQGQSMQKIVTELTRLKALADGEAIC